VQPQRHRPREIPPEPAASRCRNRPAALAAGRGRTDLANVAGQVPPQGSGWTKRRGGSDRARIPWIAEARHAGQQSFLEFGPIPPVRTPAKAGAGLGPQTEVVDQARPGERRPVKVITAPSRPVHTSVLAATYPASGVPTLGTAQRPRSTERGWGRSSHPETHGPRPGESSRSDGRKMAAAGSHDGVLVTLENGETYHIRILTRPLPRRAGVALFYRCPWCGKAMPVPLGIRVSALC
jgi:hypothetical protein